MTNADSNTANSSCYISLVKTKLKRSKPCTNREQPQHSAQQCKKAKINRLQKKKNNLQNILHYTTYINTPVSFTLRDYIRNRQSSVHVIPYIVELLSLLYSSRAVALPCLAQTMRHADQLCMQVLNRKQSQLVNKNYIWLAHSSTKTTTLLYHINNI